MLRYRPLQCSISLVCIGLTTALSCCAQDPFGNDPISTDEVPVNVGTAGAAPSPIGEVDLFERNAVVRSLIRSAPSDPAGLARAVQWMARIRRWDEVARWLKVIEQTGLDEARAHAMVGEVGAKTFQGLLSPLVPLEPANKQIVERVLQLADQYRLNPAMIAKSVSQLQSPEPSSWKPAFGVVQSTGYIGVQSFFGAVMRQGAPAPNGAMCETLRRLGDPAKDAWVVCMRTPHADARRNLMLLAAGSKDARYQSELTSLFGIADDVPEDLRALANKWMSRSESSPSGSQLFDDSSSRLRALLSRYSNVRFDDEAATGVRWLLGQDGRSLTMRDCTPAEELWFRVEGEAEVVLQSGAGAGLDSAIAAAVLLQGEDGIPATGTHLSLGAKAPLLDRYEFACLVWDAAWKYRFPTSQRVVAEQLGRFSSPMPVEVRDRLVQGLESGYTTVRYACATGLMQWMASGADRGVGNESFLGRGKLDRVVAEMVQLTTKRRAMVVGGSSSLRSHLRTLLESFDYQCEEFSSAGTALARCKEGAPVEEIFIVSRTLEMDLGQLVQRIRGTSTGASVPIAVLAESLSSSELQVLDLESQLVLGSVPPDEIGLQDILRRGRVAFGASPMSDVDKVFWKEEAGRFREAQLGKLVTAPKAPVQPKIPQTPVGQRELILKVLDSAIPLPEREQASQLFVQSLRQFGLQVSSETADGLYDVYNERGKSEVDTRELLSRMLDAVEASRGDREWGAIAP
jgi:CheY-like chemotaxis protein